MDWVFTNCRQNLINSTPKCDSKLVVVSHLKKTAINLGFILNLNYKYLGVF